MATPIDALLKTLTPIPGEGWWRNAERLMAEGVDVARMRGKDNKTLAEALVGLILKQDLYTLEHAQAIVRIHRLGQSPPTPTVWRDLLLRTDAQDMKRQEAFFSTLLEEAAIPEVAEGMRTLDGLFLMTSFACDRLDLVERLVELGVPYTMSAGQSPALVHGSQNAWNHMLERLDPRALGHSVAGKQPWWLIVAQADEGSIAQAARKWAHLNEPQELDALDLRNLNKALKAANHVPDEVARLLDQRSDWYQVRLPDSTSKPLWHVALAEAPDKVMAMLELRSDDVDWAVQDTTGDDVWAHWMQQADASPQSLPSLTLQKLASHHMPSIKGGGWLERTITPTFLLNNRGVAALIKIVGNRSDVWWGKEDTHHNLMAERLATLLHNLFNESQKTARKNLLAVVQGTDFSTLTPSLRYAIVLHEQLRPGGASSRVVEQCKAHGVALSDNILDSFTKFHTDKAEVIRIAHQEMALEQAWESTTLAGPRKPRM